MMNPGLSHRFERMERLRKRCADLLLTIPDAQRNAPLAPGKWSPVQVLTHIYDAERNALLYVGKKIQAGDSLERTGIRGWFRYIVLKLALYSPMKFRAPEIISRPDNSRSAEQVLDDWASLRSEWEEFLQAIPPKYYNRALFRHPVAGKINLRQALGFMGDHLSRHAAQLRKMKG